MAITLTVAELAAALRLSDTDEELAEATRLLGYATEAIEKYLGAAFASTPEVVVNEVTIRVAGFLFDAPFAARKDTVANAMRSSGAARMMLPYVIHGAGVTGALDAAQAAVGSTGNPVVGVAVEDGNLIVTFQDGSTDALELPAGGGGSGGGLDEGEVDLRVEAGVADWAETGDTSPIPVAKLSEVPPGGLDETDVDARVGALVEEWARLTGSTDLIPFDKLANKPTIAFMNPANPGVDDIWIQTIFSGTEHNVVFHRRNQENDAWVERFSFRTNPSYLWAEQENTDLIPADKLDNAPGLNENQVDARVDAGVSDWAEEGDTSSIPLTKLGNAPSASSWFWAASVFGPFVAGTEKAMTLRTFPIGPWADYEALRAAVMDGSVKTVAIGLFENDANDADGDHSITVVPNINALRASPGTFDAFPNWALSVDPVRFRVVFAETAPTAAADAAIPATPTFFIRVALQV